MDAAAGVNVHFFEDTAQYFFSALLAAFPNRFRQPWLTVLVAVGIHRFGDSIRVQNNPVALAQSDFALRGGPIGKFAEDRAAIVTFR